MMPLLAVVVLSVVIPLSLCLVPSLARYTVFPLLARLILVFASKFVQPSLRVEYGFGSVPFHSHAARPNVEAQAPSESDPLLDGDAVTSLRSVTLSLFSVQLNPEFLQSLALDRKGVAPIHVKSVKIKEIALHVASSWRVYVEIKRVEVVVDMLDGAEATTMEVKDAVALKIGEAAGWIQRFQGQKAKDDQETEVQAMPESSKKFSFKDRVMQQIIAQVDVDITDVHVAVDAPSVGGERTRLHVGIDRLELVSRIEHDDEVEALEVVQVSQDIRVTHRIRLGELFIESGKTTEQEDKSKLPTPVKMLSLAGIELGLNVPPMARLIGLVANFAPIPLEKRICRVEFTSARTSRIEADKEALVRTLRDLFVPFSDYQVHVVTLRIREAEEALLNPLTPDDVAYYVENFKKLEPTSKTPAAEKTDITEKLQVLETRMTVDDIVKMRSTSLELGKHFHDHDEMSLVDCQKVAEDLATKPVNVMFNSMHIVLGIKNLSLGFAEMNNKLAELALCDLAVHLDMFTLGEGEDKLGKSIDVGLGQIVLSAASAGSWDANAPKILSADFSESDSSSNPQEIKAKILQYLSGQQKIDAGLNGIQIVAATQEIEYLLMFVDRLTTDINTVLSTARAKPAPKNVDVVTPAVKADEKGIDTVDMDPFSLLKGQPLSLNLAMNGCCVTLIPAQSFSDASFAELDIAAHVEENHGRNQMDVPIELSLRVDSSQVKEVVELDVRRIGAVARFHVGSADDDDEMFDDLLVPCGFSCLYSLEVDPADSMRCLQNLQAQMPDFVFAFSNMSLALLTSCLQALSGMKTTTPEQAQMRAENARNLQEQQKQAEFDAIVERIRRLFDEIDDNKNGQIELGELLMLLRRAKVGDTLLEKELEYFVRVLFKEIDRDGSGFIDLDEMKDYLREDLMDDGTGIGTTAKSSELSGFLNLRSGDYHSVDVLEDLSGTKPTTKNKLKEAVSRTSFVERFWDVYIHECRVSRSSLNAQHPLDVQKKLVRLLKHYQAAELCWTNIVLPELDEDEKTEWVLKPGMHSGGVSEYQTAAKAIAQQKKDSIFGTSTRAVEEQILLTQLNPIKKQLRVTSDINMGNLHLMLTDPELPEHVQGRRGDFMIRDMKLSIDLKAKEIDAHMPVDWVAMTTSGNSEWTILCGVNLVATCYNELANEMEDVIEPWELVAAVSSIAGETGFAALLEAEKRFQINVTPGLLTMYRAVNDVMNGDSQEFKPSEGCRSAGSKGGSRDATCIVENRTGSTLILKLSGGGEPVKLVPNKKLRTTMLAGDDGKMYVEELEIDGWGKSIEKMVLPNFGSTNIGIVNGETTPATLFVTATCRLEEAFQQRIVLKPNTFVCNHSSLNYEVKYLTHGAEGKDSFTSDVIPMRPAERLALPLSVFMGITEIHARPAGVAEWIITATLNDEIFTSPTAVKKANERQQSQQVRILNRRGGKIVYGETQESCSEIVTQLAPSVVVRRWHLRTFFAWEVSMLPAFVVRNSLPYPLEYRFLEKKTEENADEAAELAVIEAALRVTDGEVSGAVISGAVASGLDAELSGVSCMSPGYLSVRAVTSHEGSTLTTSWSKPLLMAVHGAVEQFVTDSEDMALEDGVHVTLDRLSLPGFPRMVRFSTAYWIMNNTGMNLEFASVSKGQKSSSFEAMGTTEGFNKPQITCLKDDRLSLRPVAMSGKRPEGWFNLGKIPGSAYSSNPISDAAINDSRWCEPMNSKTINTVGECICGPTVFGVKIEGLYGAFEQGVALSFGPRFFIQNRLKEQVYIQPFGSTESADGADRAFRKRSPEEASQYLSSIKSGETTPLFHFASLKKGESLSKCQKYISISFGERWEAGIWSNVIAVSNAGDLYLQLYSPLRKRYLICKASVQVMEMNIYVILTDSSGSPPYRIENNTPYAIECNQSGESSLFAGEQKDSKYVLKTGEWYAFAWHNALSKEHKLEIRLLTTDSKSKEREYEIDDVGYHGSIIVGKVPDVVEVMAQTVVDGATRVLRFVEKEAEMRRLAAQDSVFDKELEQRKMMFASSYDIRIAGLGLSLFDALPQEVFFVSIDIIQLQKPPSSMQWTFSIFHTQVDSMLTNAKYPAVLNPIESGYSDNTIGRPPEPVVTLILDSDIESKSGVYKMLDFHLGDLALKVDIDYLVSLAKLLEPFLASETAMQKMTASTLQRVLKRQVPPFPVTELTADGNIRHQMVYFDMFRIHSISVDLEYSITRKDIVSTAGAGSHSAFFGLLTQLIGLVGSNLSGSPSLSFNAIVIVRCFSTKDRLISQLVQNFIRQGVMQAYRFIGSADIIGNPIGLVEDLGSGVAEFFKITKNEITGDSQSRGEGVKVLGKTIARSGASTLAKITGSLDKFVGELGDEEAPSQQEEEKDTPAGLKFAKDLGKGFTGIFTKPIEGIKKGGVVGLVQGTVQGITGPGVVLLKGITSTSHNLAMGVQSTVVDRSVFGGRRRQAKKVENGKVVSDSDPATAAPTRMALEVISAEGILSDKSCDPLCVVRVDGNQILRTRVLYNTVNPSWREKTQIELSGKEKEVQFVVKDSFGGAIDKTIGRCVMPMEQLIEDFRPPEFSSSLDEWVKTGVRPEDTKMNVSRQVKEKDYTLVIPRPQKSGLFGSSRPQTPADDDYQVLVRVYSLRALRITSSSGGGVLGLGNLISSTPNISAYVAVHVGKQSQHTKVGTMEFTKVDGQMKGHTEWNESFTIPVVKEELADGSAPVQLFLRDYSVLHDETLGYAALGMDLESVAAAGQPIEEEVPLRADKSLDSAIVAYLKVRVEVTASAPPPLATPTASTPGTSEPSTPNDKALKNLTVAGKLRVGIEFM